MQVESFDGSDERLAVASLCLQTDVLSRVCQHIHEKPFANRWANMVFSWCQKHYKEFGEAPGPATLTAIFGEWSLSADKTTKALVEKFLSSLQPVDMNADYCIDMIERMVTRNKARELADKVTAALSNGEVYKATDVIQQFKMPSFSEQADFVSPLEDAAIVENAFEHTKQNSLIKFSPGTPLALWMEPVLHSDALVAFIGADKSGKSSHLASLCMRAMLQGKRVAFFNLGDLSQDQCIRRWTTAICGKPVYPGKYKMPESMTCEQNEIKVDFSHRHAEQGYTKDEAVAAWGILTKGSPDRLRIVSKPAATFSVEDLDRKLDAWAQKGWLPDVVGVDYFGLFARRKGLEAHEAMDADWASMRMLSTKYKILLLTASQTKAAGYGKRWLGKEDFAGSKGINSHTNAVIGLNVDELDRTQQVARFNYVVVREAEFLANLPSRTIAVAGCPAIGRYHLKSEFI